MLLLLRRIKRIERAEMKRRMDVSDAVGLDARRGALWPRGAQAAFALSHHLGKTITPPDRFAEVG